VPASDVPGRAGAIYPTASLYILAQMSLLTTHMPVIDHHGSNRKVRLRITGKLINDAGCTVDRRRVYPSSCTGSTTGPRSVIIFVLVAVKAPSVSRRILPGMPIKKLRRQKCWGLSRRPTNLKTAHERQSFHHGNQVPTRARSTCWNWKLWCMPPCSE
jgi:hypothetical protein